MMKCFKHLKPDTRKPGAFSHRVMPEHVVAWQLNVRMRLFQPGLAFKAENPSDRILKLTATVKAPLIGMYGS